MWRLPHAHMHVLSLRMPAHAQLVAMAVAMTADISNQPNAIYSKEALECQLIMII